VVVVATAGFLAVPCCMSLVLLLTPTGSLPSARWRWLAMVSVAAAVVAALGGASATSNSVLAAHRGGWIWAISLELALVHLTIGAAVVRYRLYDLDRIISRTLAYGLLTVLFGGGYAVVVLGLGQVLGRGRSLVVAIATLAVAAAFQPARHRVQDLVDRRFNRHRYDAAKTIEAFAARLRQQVDLDTLTGELLAVVEQTMQPTQASLWLRPSAGASPDQRGTGVSRAASPPTPASRSAPTALRHTRRVRALPWSVLQGKGLGTHDRKLKSS
jgi:hypothetical protein